MCPFEVKILPRIAKNKDIDFLIVEIDNEKLQMNINKRRGTNKSC